MRRPSDQPIGWLVTTTGLVLGVKQLILRDGLLTVEARAEAPQHGTIHVGRGRHPVALFGADRNLIGVWNTNFDDDYQAEDGNTLTIVLPLHLVGDAGDTVYSRRVGAAARNVLAADVAQ